MSISQRLQSNSRVRIVPFCKRRYRGSLSIGLIFLQWPNSLSIQYLHVIRGVEGVIIFGLILSSID